MNWEAVGAVGELASAFAVLATLVYLSLQVRQQTRSMEESRKVELARSFQERTRNRFEILKLGALSNEVNALNAKLNKLGWPEKVDVLDSLSDEERRRLQSISGMQVLLLETNLYLYENGLLADAVNDTSKEFIDLMVPGWRALGLSVDHLLQGSQQSETSNDA